MAASGTGKTIGDVLDGVLTSPREFLALMLLLVCLSLMTMFVMWVFTRLFRMTTKEVQLGGAGSHIVFHTIEKSSGNEEFIVVVTPQGWQNTKINVNNGDRISFFAGGQICIDLHDIVEKVSLRQTYEDQIARTRGIKRNDASEKEVPEDYFTEEQIANVKLNRPWVGPQGFPQAAYQPSFRSRGSRYLLPEENAAGLIASVSTKTELNDPPAKLDAFFVGSSREDYLVSKHGSLWFTVNDVQYNDKQNPGLSTLFYSDNIGLFWVRVVIKKA